MGVVDDFKKNLMVQLELFDNLGKNNKKFLQWKNRSGRISQLYFFREREGCLL